MRALLAGSVLLALLAPAATEARAAPTSLSISVWSKGRGNGTAQTLTLRCDPAGGSPARPAAMCARLARLANPFRPVPRDAICTEIYGGPAEALVVGRVGSRRIWMRFHRRNGCHIARWDRHAFLFRRS